jgi:hypothetical protein
MFQRDECGPQSRMHMRLIHEGSNRVEGGRAMRMITKMLAGAAGLAAFAAAAPASAQYYPYGYNQYNYSNPYGYTGYTNYLNPAMAQQQCTAAVQSRLYNRSSIGSIIGTVLGVNTASSARVVGITNTSTTRTGMRVRGVASSGRYAYNNYSPYGVGAYGALGYNYAQAADLNFKCDVDARGYVRDVDITRRY